MTKAAPTAYTFKTTEEGHNLSLYGIPATDLDPETVAALNDEQIALIEASGLYTPVTSKPEKSGKEG